jgi:hypothetical protein
MKPNRTLLLFLLFTIAAIARAETLDPQTAKALEETQKILNDPTARKSAAGKDPQALEVEKQIEALGGSPQNAAEIYRIASQVLGNLVTQTGGDPDKMMELLDKAAKNPEAFGNTLTQDQKNEIHTLSQKLPASTGAGSAGKLP